MKLIIGLGNPEPRYGGTRHNVGFFVLDHCAQQSGASFKHVSKFQADIAEYSLVGEKILLAKPTTYYNEVGQSARAVMDFYKIDPQDILVVHDDIALPLGTIRTRTGGSDGGNNGLKSLASHIGTGTARLRIGTYTEHRDLVDDADFVLGKFTGDEQKIIVELLPKITGVIDGFLNDSFEPTTHR